MKKTITLLLLISITTAIIAEVVEKPDVVDVFIERVIGTYEKSIKNADKYYEKYTIPILKRRDGKIITAGNLAIQRLNSARKGTSELNNIKFEQEIEKIRKSLDELVGKAPKFTRKVSVLAACGKKFKEHTYLAIVARIGWQEANAMCKKMGGHLVYIETADEAFFLDKAYGFLQHWVGATDMHKEGDWRWLNGKTINKTLWKPGESTRNTNDNCAMYKQGQLYDVPQAWNDVHGFICEWE